MAVDLIPDAWGWRWGAVGLGLVLGLAVLFQAKLVGVLLVGGLLVGIGLREPSWLVAMMFGSMLLDRVGVTSAKVGDFPVTFSKISVLGSIGLWAVFVVWKGIAPVRWHPVLTCLSAFVGTTAVLIAYHSCMATGKFTLYGLLMMTVLVALVYSALVRQVLDGFYRLLGLLFCGVLVISLRGGGGASIPGEVVRASGTLGDPNEWAAMVLLVTPFLLGGLTGDDHWLGVWLRRGLLLLAPLAILESESRTALVVGLAISPALLYALRRNRGELLLGGGAALMALPFVVDTEKAFYRFSQLIKNLHGSATIPDPSLEERTELFRQGKQLFLDHWLTGAGPGNYPYKTGFISHEGHFRPAHNTYLEVASEQGIIGLIPVVLFLLILTHTLWTSWQNAVDDRRGFRVLGAALGLGAFGLMAAALNMLTFAMGYLILGCALAVATQARTHDVR